ncbi:MAG TPA: signal peptidase I, partial [Dermatophilaceae bacterium]
EPTLMPGDRILVNKIGGASSLQRGDLVVFDGTRTFADRAAGPGSGPSSVVARIMGSMASRLSIHLNESAYVKRVVGLPGDRVVCCDARGLLTINDVVLEEPYLYPGDRPSDLTFDVKVAAGRIWVLGDHRSVSADSRAHLGDPGGGMVPLDDVIGAAGLTYWPPSRVGVLRAPTLPAPISPAPESLRGVPATAEGQWHG